MQKLPRWLFWLPIIVTMLGALILIPLSEVLRAVLPQSLFSARYLIYGLILVLMMRWRPEGLIPFERARAHKAEQTRKRLATSESNK